METKLLVTIDTEENWEGPGEAKEPNLGNIYKIPELQKNIFDKFDVKPVYLLTYPVATDQKSISILREIYENNRCEIGTHLHSWHVPPIDRNDIIKKVYQCDLPYSLEKQKIAALTQVIEENFKVKPVTFRAGRWGADGETIKILRELGYKIDLSVAPLIDYSIEGGPNFYHAPFEPYFPSFDDILAPTQKNPILLEIPVTCGFSVTNFEKIRSFYRFLQKKPIKYLHIIGVLYALRLLKRIKLSPETASFEEMKRLVDVCIARGQKVLHLTFHSSMISAGDSPYAKDEKEKNMRLKSLNEILDYIVNAKKITSLTAKEIYESWQRE